MNSSWTATHPLHALLDVGLAISMAPALLAQAPTVQAPTVQAKVVAGRVSHVTLYRGQAMVTRTLVFEGPRGATEIAVDRLPTQVLPESLYAEGDEGVEVRAVRLRSRVVRREPRAEVRKIQLRIESLEVAIAAKAAARQLLGQRTAYLDQVQSFVAKAAQAELAKGSLKPETPTPGSNRPAPR